MVEHSRKFWRGLIDLANSKLQIIILDRSILDSILAPSIDKKYHPKNPIKKVMEVLRENGMPRIQGLEHYVIHTEVETGVSEMPSDNFWLTARGHHDDFHSIGGPQIVHNRERILVSEMLRYYHEREPIYRVLAPDSNIIGNYVREAVEEAARISGRHLQISSRSLG